MRILFDLDETLYIGDVVKVAVEQLRQEGHQISLYSGSDMVDFQGSNFPPILRERIFELFKDPKIAAIDKKPIWGSYPFIYYLKNIRHWEIGVLTARPSQLHEVTMFCLKRDFPDISWDMIGFANKTDGHLATVSKRRLLDKWKPTHYFDDFLGFCEEAADAGVPNVFLIKNKHTGWNQGKPISDKVKPVKSILEFDVR